MRQRWFIHLVAFFAFSFPLQAEEKQSLVFYEIQPYDQLGKILQHLGICPLWGAIGYVRDLQMLNADSMQGDELIPNRILRIPRSWIPAGNYYTQKYGRDFLLLQNVPVQKCRLGKTEIQPEKKVIALPEKDSYRGFVYLNSLLVPTEDSARSWFLSFSGVASTLALYGTEKTNGTNARFSTASSFGGQFRLIKTFGHASFVDFSVQAQKTKYQDPDFGIIGDAPSSLSGASIFAGRWLHPQFALGVVVDRSDTLFYQSSVNQVYDLKKIPLLQAGFFADLTYFKAGAASLQSRVVTKATQKGTLNGESILPGYSAAIENGLWICGERNCGKAGASYRKQWQNTEILQRTTQMLDVSLEIGRSL